MIFYYTSTGNSLYIAKQLDSKLVSIPQALKEEKLEYQDEVIGLICPDYAGEIPATVKRFLEKATLKANYLYAIITYGALDSVVAKWTYSYANQYGIHFDYVNTVLMVDNWLPSFDMLEQIAVDKQIPQQLEQIKRDLSNHKVYVKEYTQQGKEIYDLVQKMNKDNPERFNGSAIQCDTTKCIGCGICTKVCPVGRNGLEKGKRIALKDTCDFCLGCIHACPQNAMYLTIPEKNSKARYRNPNINVREIMEANQQ